MWYSFWFAWSLRSHLVSLSDFTVMFTWFFNTLNLCVPAENKVKSFCTCPKNPTASLEELAASSMTRFHTGRSQLWDSVWAIWLVLLGACPSYWPHCQKLALCNLQIELSACSAFLSLLTESPQILLRSAARPRTRQVHTAVL